MVDINVADFRNVNDRPGLRPTCANPSLWTEPSYDSEPVLTEYARYFTRVLKAGFGSDKDIGYDDLDREHDAVLERIEELEDEIARYPCRCARDVALKTAFMERMLDRAGGLRHQSSGNLGMNGWLETCLRSMRPITEHNCQPRRRNLALAIDG